jgi:serine/threonine protein kinase
MSESPATHRIGRLLGRGAVASVHEVQDAKGHKFAGKLLHASRDGDLSARARLAQEARLLEGLEHPNIVAVHGLARGVDEAAVEWEFVCMELVEGCGLDVLVARDAPMSEVRVAGFGRQLAEGLAHAHAHGVVHRDLKPANVLVADPDGDQPVLKIADFGMARASSLSGLDPGALTVLGTPDYMAPETLEPLAVDARTDLYALGCMLYEMLTGGVPFPAATPFGILRRHREDPIPRLPEHVSLGMRAMVESLLAKSPADRPASATIVARRLASIVDGESALVPMSSGADSIGSACASCGQPLVDHVAVCLNCGLPSATLERGGHSVVITGPGEVGDKMDSKLRQQLRRWLEQNPQLGLRGDKWLEKRIPRMPIVFVTRISQRSANAIVASLAALGFSAEAIEGGGLRHPKIRDKAK